MANSKFFSPVSCFHHQTTTAPTSNHRKEPPSAFLDPNLSTSLHYTDFGLFTITWSSTLLGHSFHIHLDDDNLTTLSPFSNSLSFNLHMNTFHFWRKRGSKKLTNNSREVHVFWDFRRSKFGPRPEPESGFYLAVIISGQIALLVGDLTTKAYQKTKVTPSEGAAARTLVYKSEHVHGKGLYTTKARLGGRNRAMAIEYSNFNEDRVLYFSVDSKIILQVNHLKWKFRGNVRVEFENFFVNVSWDVYDWLFDKEKKTNSIGRHAVFLFKFQEKTYGAYENFQGSIREDFLHDEKTGMSQFQMMKLRRKKSLMRSSGNWSSSSISSSFSSRSNSSVMEWETIEEKELDSSSGLSLLVHAWKR